MSLRDPRTQKILIASVAAAGILWSFFVADFLPVAYPRRAREIDKLRKDYETVSAELEKAKRTVATLPQLEQEHAELQKRWNEAQALLPTDKEMARLLSQITMAGEEAGVAFELFKPGTPRPQEFFNENPIEVTVACGYHQLGVFMSRLANLSRIVNVSQVHLKGHDARTREKNKESGRDDETVSVNFLATAYSLRDPGEVGAEAAAAEKAGKAAKGRPTRGLRAAKNAAASSGGEKP